MARVKFLESGEVSQKNIKYVKNKTRKQIWQVVSIVEALVITYLLFFKH